MPSAARIFWLAGRLASALLLLAGPHALAAGPDTDPARRLEAVVRVQDFFRALWGRGRSRDHGRADREPARRTARDRRQDDRPLTLLSSARIIEGRSPMFGPRIGLGPRGRQARTSSITEGSARE